MNTIAACNEVLDEILTLCYERAYYEAGLDDDPNTGRPVPLNDLSAEDAEDVLAGLVQFSRGF